MVELDVSSASTTDLTNAVEDFSVTSASLDSEGANQNETYWDFPDAPTYLGYYKSIPELKSAIDTLVIWTIGKGFKTNSQNVGIMARWRGWGEDSQLAILRNLLTQKKIFGDAFAEIIVDDKGDPLNLKPLYTGDMRVVVDANGMIKRYEQRTKVNGRTNIKKFNPGEIFHISNDRVGNEIHGVSVIESCKWVIDAKNEAMRDERMIKHRELALGILYLDEDDATKRNALMAQYEKAIKNGEVLVLPKDTAEIKDAPVTPKERIQWIQYLDNFFYQCVRVPKVIANSGDFSEASSKVGYLTFEPIYTAEQTELESDMLSQLGIEGKFNRPPSLTGVVSEEEQKNTGQTGIQPNDVQASISRSE